MHCTNSTVSRWSYKSEAVYESERNGSLKLLDWEPTINRTMMNFFIKKENMSKNIFFLQENRPKIFTCGIDARITNPRKLQEQLEYVLKTI